MSYAFETVTVQHERAKAPKQVRITGRIKRVIDLMVHEGQRRAEAAKTVGITDEAVRQALLKPQVLAYLNHQKGVLRTSAMARTVAVVEGLLDADSESVRLDAVKYLEPPVSKSEITHTHQGHIQGLTIVFTSPSDAAPMIDVTPQTADKAKLINSLPKPVAHPAMATDLISSVMGNGAENTNTTKSLARVQRSANKAHAPSAPHIGGAGPRPRKRVLTPPGGQK